MATASRSCCSHIVDLDIDGARTLFEFAPTEDRAFSVGASPNCDLRVDRRGTPQVAFYLERRGESIWLVPAYRRGGLRVNGVATVAPRRIGRAAVIGFGEVHALLTVRSTSGPHERDEASEPRTQVNASTRRSRRSYLESLPDSEDRTITDQRDPAGSEPPERTSVIRSTRAAARVAQRAPSSAPHLWELLGTRPLEALAFVLVIGLWITGVALAVAVLLGP